MLRSQIWRTVAPVLLLVMGVGACGDADDDATVADPTTTAGGDATPGQAAADDDEGVDPDATLRFGYYLGPSRWDPARATSSFDNTSLAITYDRLIHQSPDADAVPGLATEWSFADDGSSLELSLREGVVFHDGEPFDAEAVKANIERGLTLEGASVTAELEVIESVEVLDPMTVRLNLNGPGASLPLVLSDRAGMMVSPAAFDNPDLDRNPVGAGMYRMTEYQEDALIVYERFEDYWDPDAQGVQRIELVIQTDPVTRLNALRSGQLDLTFVDAQQEQEAIDAGFEVDRHTGLALMHLQLNRERPWFADERVRRALNHAIDREAIVDGVLFGIGNPSDQSFPEGYFAFDPETGTQTYPHDPELARELLAEAGYADGFAFEFIVPSVPLNVQLGEVTKAQLAEVGIDAQIRQVEPVQTADIFYSNEEGDALIATWGGRPDPSQTLNLLYSDRGFSNPGRHSTPEVMAAFDETLEVQSPEERADDLQVAAAQVVADALDVVYYFPVTPWAYDEGVVGFEQWISGKPELRGVRVRTD